MGIFNGVAQGEASSYEDGGILHISVEHGFKFRVGLGLTTNNYAELSALRLLLWLALKKGINPLQFFGNS